MFSFQVTDPARHGPPVVPLDRQLDLVARANLRKAQIPGSADYLHLFGWAQTGQFGHWEAYDHYDAVGSKERFRKAVQECRQTGVPVGLYLDGYVVADKSDKPAEPTSRNGPSKGRASRVRTKPTAPGPCVPM